MNLERYNIIKEVLEMNTIDIDLEKGIAIRKVGRGKNKLIGCLDKKTNYRVLSITGKEKTIQIRLHELIAVAGGLYPVNQSIDHIDGNKLNNSITNLEVVSLAENSRRQHKNKLINVKGEKNPMAKLNEEKVKEIKKLLQEGELSQRKIAIKYNVTPMIISKIKRGELWRDVQ